jgi:hypothetical protein
MSGFFEYIRSLVKANTLDSSKSFSLLCSILTGSMLCVCIMFCLIWDVCTNGYIKTNLSDLGLFVCCIGVYMAGGGLAKTVSDAARNKKYFGNNGKENENT